MKRIIGFVLVLAILLMSCPITWAEEMENLQLEAKLIQAGSANPPQTVPTNRVMLRSQGNYEGAYQALYQGMKNRTAEIPMQQYGIPYDGTIIVNLFSKVVNDNGDLFYLASSFSASGNAQMGLVAIYPHYLAEITQTEINLFDETVTYIISKVTGDGMADEDKVLAVHDYIINNCEYDLENYYNDTVPPLSYTAYGALINKIAVCQGYAIGMNYILKKLGVEALYVSSDPMHHGWSMVRLNGFWYHVDPTWDDPVPDRPNQASRYFFLLSDATMLEREHYGWDNTLPACYSTLYETGYPFHGNNAIFHYRNGFFWFQIYNNYFRSDFRGTNTISVSQQEFIIDPKMPYSLYSPIVYDANGNVMQTTLSNLGRAKLAVDAHEGEKVNASLFLAYYGSEDNLLQINCYPITLNERNYDLSAFSQDMPQGSKSAKIFLWDSVRLTDLSNLIVYQNN